MKTGLLVIWSSMQTSADNLPGPIAVFPLGWNIALFCFCTSVHMLTGIPLHNFSLIQCPVQTVIHHLQNDKESCYHWAVDSYYHHGRRKSLSKKVRKKLMNTRLNIHKNTIQVLTVCFIRKYDHSESYTTYSQSLCEKCQKSCNTEKRNSWTTKDTKSPKPCAKWTRLTEAWEPRSTLILFFHTFAMQDSD